MDDENKTPPSPEQLQLEPVLQLEGAPVGETETDEPRIARHVSFELPSTSRQARQWDEAKALVRELIETLLPRFQSDGEMENPNAAGMLQYDDDRLHRILRLLERYTRNLEAIEEHVLQASLDSGPHLELQMTRTCETQTTQTLPLNSLRPNMNSSLLKAKMNSTLGELNSQQSYQPPCERIHHTITISATSSAAFTTPPRPRTLRGRIGRTLGDFAGAICLCFHVNKDCIFCLGFFLAFVISASFLTAFFYRTINLTTNAVRVPADPVPVTPIHPSYTDTLRLNGGYYYIYNNHRQHIV